MRKFPIYAGLFFVQGVQDHSSSSTPNSYAHFWGGNLEGVHQHPIATGHPELDERVVYSPHIYGPDVWMQKYFDSPDVASILNDVWHLHFGFVEEITDNPIVIGEWGGQYWPGTKDRAWADALGEFMLQNCMSDNFYWCLNPNSFSTGGILSEDWKTPRIDKLLLLQKIQPNPSRLVPNRRMYCFYPGAFANSNCSKNEASGTEKNNQDTPNQTPVTTVTTKGNRQPVYVRPQGGPTRTIIMQPQRPNQPQTIGNQTDKLPKIINQPRPKWVNDNSQTRTFVIQPSEPKGQIGGSHDQGFQPDNEAETNPNWLNSNSRTIVVRPMNTFGQNTKNANSNNMNQSKQNWGNTNTRIQTVKPKEPMVHSSMIPSNNDYQSNTGFINTNTRTIFVRPEESELQTDTGFIADNSQGMDDIWGSTNTRTMVVQPEQPARQNDMNSAPMNMNQPDMNYINTDAGSILVRPLEPKQPTVNTYQPKPKWIIPTIIHREISSTPMTPSAEILPDAETENISSDYWTTHAESIATMTEGGPDRTIHQIKPIIVPAPDGIPAMPEEDIPTGYRQPDLPDFSKPLHPISEPLEHMGLLLQVERVNVWETFWPETSVLSELKLLLRDGVYSILNSVITLQCPSS